MKKALDQYHRLYEAFSVFNAEFFNKELPDVFITLQRKAGAYGYFSSKKFSNGKKDLDEIAMNPDFFFYGDRETLQTLAHEMCHMWQFHCGKPSIKTYHNKEWADKMESIGLMPSNTGKEGGKRTGQFMADYIIPGSVFEDVISKLLVKGNIIDWKSMSYESCYMQQLNILSETQVSLENDVTIKTGSFITIGQNTSVVDSIDEENNIANIHTVSGDSFETGENEAFIKIPTKSNKNKVKYSCPECGLNVWGKPDLYIICGNCNLSIESL